MDGRKSPFVTFILSFLPGVGHMYLGLNKRGLQFMAAFFGTIFLIDLLSTGPLLPFVLVIIWFYSMFDALQMTSRINHYLEHGGGNDFEPFDPSELKVQNLIDPLWIGGGVIVIGVLMIIRSFVPDLWRILRQSNFGTGLLGLVLIAFGVYLVYRHLSVTQQRNGNGNGYDAARPPAVPPATPPPAPAPMASSAPTATTAPTAPAPAVPAAPPVPPASAAPAEPLAAPAAQAASAAPTATPAPSPADAVNRDVADADETGRDAR